MNYIRRTYGVPAKRGAAVEALGEVGKITRCDTHYIYVRIEGEKRPRPYHPLDVKFLPKSES